MTLEIPPVIAKRELLSAVVTPEKKQSKKEERGGALRLALGDAII